MMLHKVIRKTEKSKAKGPTGAINYLAGYSWRNTQPQMLRGNLEVTRELLSHEDKDPYTHGVLSYEENALDVPQSEQDFAMNLIEETLMTGFPQEHYDIVWIRHDDKDFDPKRGSGRLELNYHIVNRDLVTGKKITPYLHKYDMHRVNLAKQIINDKFGYSSPDDPKRARTINLQGYGSELKGAAKELNDFVINGIETEQIDSRNDIINALQQRDDVEHVEPNKSDTYLVVKLKGVSRNLRLKGIIYGKEFTNLGGLQEKQTNDGQRFDREREQRLASNIEELQQLNTNRAEKRQRLIDPKRKRGRKSKKESAGFSKNNDNRIKESNNSNDKPEYTITKQVADSKRTDTPLQQKSDPELPSSAASPSDAGKISGQVPVGNPDNSPPISTDRSGYWNTFTVLTFKPKTKIKEHDSKENTNTSKQKAFRTRATIEAENPTIRSNIRTEQSELRSDLGSILRAAIYARDFIARIIKAVRSNQSAIRSNISAVFSINARAASERTVTNDYDELNAKCDKLDRLLREKGSSLIILGLDIANEVKAEQLKPSPRPRFRM
jgi:hypothetical protein